MFLSEAHLGTVCQADPIRDAISILSDAPESTIFDLYDFEIDGFAAAGVVPDSNSDDTARKEMLSHLAGEDLPGPVGGFIHEDGIQSAVVAGLGRGHCSAVIVVAGGRQGDSKVEDTRRSLKSEGGARRQNSGIWMMSHSLPQNPTTTHGPSR